MMPLPAVSRDREMTMDTRIAEAARRYVAALDAFRADPYAPRSSAPVEAAEEAMHDAIASAVTP